MRREEPVTRQTCGELVTVLIVYCLNHIIETRKIIAMPDNLFETLSPTQDYTNKIITFLKLIDMYNLI